MRLAFSRICTIHNVHVHVTPPIDDLCGALYIEWVKDSSPGGWAGGEDLLPGVSGSGHLHHIS